MKRQALLLIALCTITWNAVLDPELSGYALYTSLVSGQYTQGPAWIGNSTQAICEDLGLTADNLTHYFIVKMFRTNGESSGPSNEASKLLAVSTSPPPRVCLKFNPNGKCTKWK